MAVRKELIEELLANRNPEEVFAQDGLLDELKKALAERILNAEMDQHLAAERADEVIGEPRNHRNGHSRKTVLTGTGKLDLQVPRDRQASFEPQLIAKYRRRFPDFDDKVVSLYARGMTVREIQGHLRELYGVEVSPDLISVVTDAVLEQVAEWQNRPLECRLPGSPDPDLHRAPDPPLAGLRVVEGAPRGRSGVEADLPRRQCRTRSSTAGRICHRLLGSALSRHCAGLAAAMGTGRAVLRLSHGGAQNHLHNECDRKSAQPIAQSRACPRALPQR